MDWLFIFALYSQQAGMSEFGHWPYATQAECERFADEEIHRLHDKYGEGTWVVVDCVDMRKLVEKGAP